MAGPIETEVKVALPDSIAILEEFGRLGLTLSVPRQFESNTIYDSPDGRLRQAGMLLRLRQAGSKSLITWKGQGESNKHKSRPELETTIGSIEVMQKVLGRLGFCPVFRYEKYRREFTENGNAAGVVTLDETPIGDFLELEGEAEWIDEMAGRLRFSSKNYLLESYGQLYLDFCKRQGVAPQNMVFTSESMSA